MDKNSFLKALEEAQKKSKKRRFVQSIDLIINLGGSDIKKQGNINIFVILPHKKSKKATVCALVDEDLAKQARGVFDRTVTKQEFRTLDKKTLKSIAQCDFVVAEATLMTDVAKFFGKLLGPKGKMPNPKTGCVVPPNANILQVYEKLQNLVKLDTKNESSIKCSAGDEGMDRDKLCDNMEAVYNAVMHALPDGVHNIKEVLVKLTMGVPVQVK